jgi:hypothetical protein
MDDLLEILHRASGTGLHVKFHCNYTYHSFNLFHISSHFHSSADKKKNRICLNKCTRYISLESEVKNCFL